MSETMISEVEALYIRSVEHRGEGTIIQGVPISKDLAARIESERDNMRFMFPGIFAGTDTNESSTEALHSVYKKALQPLVKDLEVSDDLVSMDVPEATYKTGMIYIPG